MSDAVTIQTVVSFVASAVGALVAGYAGVWFGLARLKRERGYDQQLAWSKEMLQALHAVARLLDNIGEAGSPEATALLETDPTRVAEIKRFDLVFAEARAYATPKALSALAVVASFFRAINAEPDPASAEQIQARLGHHLDALRRASEALCDDVRAHLGLEAATESSWPFAAAKEIRWAKSIPPAS